ncbi:hypothetical protein [Streptomyces sp. NPDC001435]|uniref:hypothetical protein n=1 Tax=unclassified Streptomyces TaxID=2593676 RepID=UPI0036CAABF0
MRLITDGVIPVPRLALIDTIETDDGHFCELAGPLTPAGAWGVRCIHLRTTHATESAESAQATA